MVHLRLQTGDDMAAVFLSFNGSRLRFTLLAVESILTTKLVQNLLAVLLGSLGGVWPIISI